MENHLSLETTEEWTQWLNEYSESKTLVWLRIKRKKSQKTGIYLEEAVTEALRFGWIDGRLNPMDEDYFWLRFSPRKPKSVWSLINRKRVELMIGNNTLTPLGYQTVEWAKQNGTWQASYTSFKDTHIPIEFTQSLKRNSEAQKRYESLVNADKLKLLYWLNTSQTDIIFINRLNRILEWLKSDKPINKLKSK